MNGGFLMVFVVLVYWKIKPGKENEDRLMEKWSQMIPTKDPSSGFIAEFLSRVDLPSESNTWDLTRDTMTTFVNVGLWRSKADFKREILDKFTGQLNAFEINFETAQRGRERALLELVKWRLGGSYLGFREGQ